LVSGHSRGVKGDINYPEVWGCAIHPTKQIFASAGADMTVRIWSADKMIAVSEKLNFDPTALDWSHDGQFIAVGDRNGTA
jgi:WD40 repeat protein